MFTIDVRHALSGALRAVRRPFDHRPRGRTQRRRACATTICSTPSRTANAPTTHRSAAAPAWCCGSSRSLESSTPSLREAPPDERRAIVVPSPGGQPFAHRDAARWAELDRLIIVCGHYEGIDDRLGALYPIEERSLGDFVLTGGEIPALAFMDATVRLVAGAIRPESLRSESFAEGLLDYPSYTRPATFRGVDVPAVLLSGDHAKIAQWRRAESRRRTAARRRDLLGHEQPQNALHREEGP